MPVDWQNLVVGILVLAACAYLARQAWLVVRRKRAGNCGGGCTKCESDAPTRGPDVTTIKLPD